MKANIWKLPYGWDQSFGRDIHVTLTPKGFVELLEFDADECWHLCNWSCWLSQKPKNLHSDLDVANSDVVFHDEIRNEYHLALRSGWHVCNSLIEVVEYCNKVQSGELSAYK
jgi:hypothetical protein